MVTVIIPVYNCEKYIERCVQSILVQDYHDLEIIIVDDGSKDNSLEICKRNAEKDERIIVYSIENSGASAARKYGVERATGEYIRFVDADDTLPFNSISNLLKKAIQFDLDIAQGANEYIEINGNRSVHYVPAHGFFENTDFVRLLIESKVNVGPWASLYRRTLFSSDTFNLPKEVKLNEDKYMNICLAIDAKKIGVFNDIIIYEYYQVNTSTTNSYQFKDTIQSEQLYINIEKVLRKAHLYDELKELVIMGKVNAAMTCCLHNEKLIKDKWVLSVMEESKNIKLPTMLSLIKLSMKSPNVLFPIFFWMNTLRRILKRY
ncbi:MAG: glycosyltransferase family 2 protein [Prevotella sp.]|nr:glycosyltransferase family 2 protein [Prevotellaceae bacterium]MDY3935560.1 glycosyltransferase family 2 protein [Prevotella sp.]